MINTKTPLANIKKDIDDALQIILSILPKTAKNRFGVLYKAFKLDQGKTVTIREFLKEIDPPKNNIVLKRYEKTADTMCDRIQDYIDDRADLNKSKIRIYIEKYKTKANWGSLKRFKMPIYRLKVTYGKHSYLDILDSYNKKGIKKSISIKSDTYIVNELLEFLKQLEHDFGKVKFFHPPYEVNLIDIYIPINVTTEIKYLYEPEIFDGYSESNEELKKRYTFKRIDFDATQSKPWNQVVKGLKKNNIMVLADPGMGKTTLLQQEARQFSSNQIETLKKNNTLDDVHIPIFIKLPSLMEYTGSFIKRILLILQEEYSKYWDSLGDLITLKLSTGKCSLFLDAFDEVPYNFRHNLFKNIDQYYKNYSCRIFCSSRMVGYNRPSLKNLKEIKIVPFNQNQIETYITLWFDSICSEKSRFGHDLVDELNQNPRINGMAQIPLLLSLICSLFQSRDYNLPTRRCMLYKQTVDYMLRDWTKNRGDQQKERIDVKNEFLEKIAYHFSCHNLTQFDYNKLKYFIVENSKEWKKHYDFGDAISLIDELSRGDSILLPVDSNRKLYMFFQRTFQEFLTASYIKNNFVVDTDKWNKDIRPRYWDFEWHETISLIAGLLKDPITLLNNIKGQKDDIFHSLLVLSGRCISECNEMFNPIIKSIVEKIYSLWKESHPSSGYANIFQKSYIDSIVNNLAQANSHMLELFISLLKNKNFWLKDYAARTLGEIGTSNAIEALIEVVEGEDEFLRWRTLKVLGETRNSKATDVLIGMLKDENDSIKISAVVSLGKIGDTKATDALIKMLEGEDDNTRISVIRALGEAVSHKAVDALIETLKDEDDSIRISAVISLGKIGDAKATDTLMELLRDKDSFVRYNAARALRKLNASKATDALTGTLKNGNGFERVLAAKALGIIGDSNAIRALIEVLDEGDDSISESAIYALGEIGDPAAIDPLIETLKDENDIAKYSAAIALGKIGNAKATDTLIEVIDEKNEYDLKSVVVTALGKIGDHKATDTLIEALEFKNDSFRKSVIKALGEIGDPTANDALIDLLKDENDSIRKSSIKALGKIGSFKATDALIEALKNWDRFTRDKAVKPFGKIGDLAEIESLIKVIKHVNENIGVLVIKALGEICDPKAIDALAEMLEDEEENIRASTIFTLEKIDGLKALEWIIKSPTISLYRRYYYLLARNLMIKYSKERKNRKIDYIPVYPELIKKHKPNQKKPLWLTDS